MPRTEHKMSQKQSVQAEKKKFARDLREWRKAHGMTLDESAEKFGVSRGLIQALEEARSCPSFATVFSSAAARPT